MNRFPTGCWGVVRSTINAVWPNAGDSLPCLSFGVLQVSNLGHVLGLPDNAEAGDLLDITLGPGVRRVPSSTEMEAVASSSTRSALGQPGPAVSNGRLAAIPASAAALIDPAASGLLGDQNGSPMPANSGAPTVAGPLSVGHQPPPPQSSPLTGPVSRAMIDAALASMLNLSRRRWRHQRPDGGARLARNVRWPRFKPGDDSQERAALLRPLCRTPKCFFVTVYSEARSPRPLFCHRHQRILERAARLRTITTSPGALSGSAP